MTQDQDQVFDNQEGTPETLEQWRMLRAEQDREYEECLQEDREKVSIIILIPQLNNICSG